jgi:ornithine cyclodeaminase/alanine dehydrogenase-like protein (mu-crystallin family)
MAGSYVEEMSSQFNFKIEQAQTSEQAVQGVDVIITATLSTGLTNSSKKLRNGHDKN